MHATAAESCTLTWLLGKSSLAKILGNYAVRLGQKPVRSSRMFLCIFLTFEQLLVDLDCAGGLSNIPGSICAATMTRVIPPVSSWVSQPWHRAPLAFFVAHEKPDSDPDAFLNAVTCVEKQPAFLLRSRL